MPKKLFIHIPKNGGGTVKRTYPKLIELPQDHLDPVYKKSLDKTFTGVYPDGKKVPGINPNYTHCRWRDLTDYAKNHFQAFAIVRNPWSKVVSRYTFRILTNTKMGYKWYPDKTLEEFLEERHVDGGRKHFWHRAIPGWFQQLDHVTNANGVLKCDVLRFEHFADDITSYLGVKNRPVRLQNVSNGRDQGGQIVDKKDYKKFYNDTTREIVAEWYKQDIDFFGFTFEGAATKNVWRRK